MNELGLANMRDRRSITVVGKVSASVLRHLPSFVSATKGEKDINIVFVMRSEHDFPIGTTFRICQGTTTNIVELTAATQQFDKPMDAIPHGWKTICAFRLLGNGVSILTGLPFANDWYGNETALALEEITSP